MPALSRRVTFRMSSTILTRPSLHEPVDVIPQRNVPFLEDQPAFELEDRDVADSAFGDPHGVLPRHTSSQSRYLMNTTSFRASL